MSSISPRKGRLQCIAITLVGSAICVGSLAMFVQTQLPASHVAGIISFVQVHSAGKGYSTEVLLQTATGEELPAYAQGRSIFFRQGEQVELSYRKQTGMIVQAHFFGVDGKEEGIFNSTNPWTAGAGFLLGLYVIWGAFEMKKRDPEGAKERWGLRQAPLNSVDKGSLFHKPDDHQD